MAHTYEDMKREARDWLKSYLPQLDPEERLEGLDPEARLRGFDPETRLKGLDPDLIEAWLNKQRRDHLVHAMNHQPVSNEQSPQAAHSWKLQDAKVRFSELVRLATDSGPRHVTVNGQPKVVVLSETEYEPSRFSWGKTRRFERIVRRFFGSISLLRIKSGRTLTHRLHEV